MTNKLIVLFLLKLAYFKEFMHQIEQVIILILKCFCLENYHF